ncbi:hypothetical protein DYH09_01225 [bacterium CPR1]|nr:hypothetical protein [bacterium CPR1]
MSDPFSSHNPAMEKSIPGWALKEIQTYQKTNTLGNQAKRTDLSETDAFQAASSLAGQIDQIGQLKDTEHDACKGEPGVFQPVMAPAQSPLGGPPLPAPRLRFEGNSSQGWTVTDMSQGPLQSLSVIVYTEQAIDSYILIKTPLGSGAQLLHLDRKELARSYNEISGGIWELLGGLVQKWANQQSPGPS